MTRHSSKRLLFPDPVLQHLRRNFHKVGLHQSSTELGKSCLIHTNESSSASTAHIYTQNKFNAARIKVSHLRAEFVHHMTKLVEKGLHFMVLEQRGPAFPWLCKVSHHGCYWKSAFSIRPSAAGQQPKASSVAIFPLPGEEKSPTGWIFTQIITQRAWITNSITIYLFLYEYADLSAYKQLLFCKSWDAV